MCHLSHNLYLFKLLCNWMSSNSGSGYETQFGEAGVGGIKTRNEALNSCCNYIAILFGWAPSMTAHSCSLPPHCSISDAFSHDPGQCGRLSMRPLKSHMLKKTTKRQNEEPLQIFYSSANSYSHNINKYLLGRVLRTQELLKLPSLTKKMYNLGKTSGTKKVHHLL